MIGYWAQISDQYQNDKDMFNISPREGISSTHKIQSNSVNHPYEENKANHVYHINQVNQ